MAEGCRKERFRRCAMAAGGVALVAVGCLSVAEMRRPGRSARSDALLGGRAALTSRPQAERDGRLSALMGIDTDAPGAALNWEKKHPEEEVTVIEYMDDLWGEQVGADHALREKQLEAAQPSQDAADVAPTTVVGLPLATTPPPAPIPECAMPVSPPERCNGLQEVHGQEGTVTAGEWDFPKSFCVHTTACCWGVLRAAAGVERPGTDNGLPRADCRRVWRGL